MANTKISALPTAGIVTDNDVATGLQGGVNKNFKLAQLNLWDVDTGLIIPKPTVDVVAPYNKKVGVLDIDIETDATFVATFRTSVDADFAIGSKTATAVGGASIVGGKLDLAHGDKRYVDFSAVQNADSGSIGTYRFKYFPNYNGSPASDQYIVTVCQANASTVNYQSLIHRVNGHLAILSYNSSGTLVVDTDQGLWQPILGSKHIFELDYEWTAAAEEAQLFVDGNQQGSSIASTISRSNAITLLRVGMGFDSDVAIPNPITSNFMLQDLEIFNVLKHQGFDPFNPDYLPFKEKSYISKDYSPLRNVHAIGNLAIDQELDVTAHAGGGQLLATSVYRDFVLVSFSSADGDSIMLMQMYEGLSHVKTIKNVSPHTIHVYPRPQGYIDRVPDGYHAIAPNTAAHFWQLTSDVWETSDRWETI